MHVIDLQAACTEILDKKASKIMLANHESTIECLPENYLSIMQILRDHEDLHFESLVDLCGVDYSTYKNEKWQGKRF
ncbi:NADH-quinone oxidoreductase subunit C, partial [Kingella kingae]|uniref:NADH-quinone oxidoreductase subunit C n=1 Tax=Kingella kingae TaxID=504 RepID=UPI002E332D4A